MNRRASLLVACCFFLGACARGKAGVLSLLDASTGTIHGLDGSAAGPDDGSTGLLDAAHDCELYGDCSSTHDASHPAQPDAQAGHPDAHVAQPDAGHHDAQVGELDADTGEPDAGGPRTRMATF